MFASNVGAGVGHVKLRQCGGVGFTDGSDVYGSAQVQQLAEIEFGQLVVVKARMLLASQRPERT